MYPLFLHNACFKYSQALCGCICLLGFISRENIMAIKNLTPHKITIIKDDGTEIGLYPEGIVARIKTKSVLAGNVHGFNLYKTEYGEVIDLPEPAEDENGTIYYIVSALVKNALPNRKDLISPSQQVRDDQGRVIGCKGFE